VLTVSVPGGVPAPGAGALHGARRHAPAGGPGRGLVPHRGRGSVPRGTGTHHAGPRDLGRAGDRRRRGLGQHRGGSHHPGDAGRGARPLAERPLAAARPVPASLSLAALARRPSCSAPIGGGAADLVGAGPGSHPPALQIYGEPVRSGWCIGWRGRSTTAPGRRAGRPPQQTSSDRVQAWEVPTSPKWPVAEYRVRVEVQDAAGAAATAETPFTLRASPP
jgi:hypothetical protein